MKARKLAAILAFSAVVLVAAACSGQKGQDYAGEPLAQVRGSVVLASAPAPAQATVVMAWTNFAKQGDTSVAVQLPAQASFPSNFTLDIVVAPLPEQMNDFGGNGKLPNEVRIGLAGIVAVAPGTDLSGRTRPVPVLGVVEDYEVVYVERDAVPNTIAAAFLGGPLRAGFHLMRVVRSSLSSVDQYKASQACYAALPPGTSEQQRYVQCHPSDIFDKLQEAEQGFDTNITLKLAPAKQLDFPNTF